MTIHDWFDVSEKGISSGILWLQPLVRTSAYYWTVAATLSKDVRLLLWEVQLLRVAI
jgi:hypothetical protein